MNNLRRAAGYALGMFSVCLAVDLAYWVTMRRAGREIIPSEIGLAVYLLTLVFVSIAVAVRADKHPVLTSTAVSGIAFFALWAVKAPLTLIFPGFLQRDHDGWVGSLMFEGVWVGCLAAAIATVLALGARLSMWVWRYRRAQSV
jgi:hypothetical protein